MGTKMKKVGVRKIKKPVDVFGACPSCDSHNLIKFEDQVLCGFCDWNSISIFEECLAETRTRKPAVSLVFSSEDSPVRDELDFSDVSKNSNHGEKYATA